MTNSLLSYTRQASQAARFIGQGFLVTLDHINDLLLQFNIHIKSLFRRTLSEREFILNLISVLPVRFVFAFPY